MEFKEFTEELFPLAAKHYVETFNAPPWNDKWTERLVIEKLHEIMDCKNAFGLVCFDDNKNFSGAILGNSEIYFDCRQFYIKEFFVPLNLQGKGIGTRMLEEFEHRLTNLGIKKAYLITSKGTKTEDFYKKKGFVTWENLVLMGKKL